MSEKRTVPVGVVLAKAGLLAGGLACAVFWNPLVGIGLLAVWVFAEILVWMGSKS